MKDKIIGFIGAGNMASSIIRGLIKSGKAPATILVKDIDKVKLEYLADETGIKPSSVNDIRTIADAVVLAVKPQLMKPVCLEIKAFDLSKLLVSVAAGVKIAQLEDWLDKPAALVRCMPNTPALIGQGASGLFANEFTSEQQKELAQYIMDSVGLTVWLKREDDIDTVTALSGSGPAYFFLFMEAMQEFAQEFGLEQEVAETLICQTAVGASELARQSEDSTIELRKKVTSPGGTTERAIRKFENGNLKGLVREALITARNRSIELSGGR